MEERQELRRPRKRNVDILDHRLRIAAAQACEPARETHFEFEAHYLGVGARVQSLASKQPADDRVLREEILRAPEQSVSQRQM